MLAHNSDLYMVWKHGALKIDGKTLISAWNEMYG